MAEDIIQVAMGDIMLEEMGLLIKEVITGIRQAIIDMEFTRQLDVEEDEV